MAYRDSIVSLAETQELSFEVVFNALSQAISVFALNYVFVNDPDAAVDEKLLLGIVERFNEQTTLIAKQGLANIRNADEAQDEAGR